MTKHLRIGTIHLALHPKYDDYFALRIGSYLDMASPKEYVIETDVSDHLDSTIEGSYVSTDNQDIRFTENEEVVVVYAPGNRNVVKARIEFHIGDRHATLRLNREEIADLAMTEYVLYGVIFMEIAVIEGYLPLHASALSLDGQAVLLCGPSQIGKSTQTGLWKERFPDLLEVINEDKPLLRLDPSGWFVCGSPFSGSTAVQSNIQRPVRGIILLQKGKTDHLRRIAPKEAVIDLIKNTFHPNSERQWDKLLTQIDRLAVNVPIYRLDATKTTNAVNAVYDELFGGIE